MTKRHTLTSAALTIGAAVLAAVPAHADITDPGGNNLDIIDHISALNTNINSDPTTSEVRNANTRADSHKNSSTFQ
ncbi:hypothetical protein ABZY57_09530 [Streptomyces sp. NPDC006450]|uniref:hypothetical protein n=1 Tax=Streptomyces sp. NPDC006450 TaxID=3155458 RepID=UPI0033BC4996